MAQETYDPCCVVCPYCGEEHGDCFEWVTETPTEHDCQNPDCGKTFACYAEYSVTYYAEPVEAEEAA